MYNYNNDDDHHENNNDNAYENNKLLADAMKQVFPLALVGLATGSIIGLSNLFISKISNNNLISNDLKKYKYIMNDNNLTNLLKEFFKYLTICPSYKHYLLNYCNKIIKIWYMSNIAYQNLPEERKNSFIINHDMITKIIDYRNKLGSILGEINNITYVFNNYWMICGKLIMAEPTNPEIVDKKNQMVNYILKTGDIPKFENNFLIKLSNTAATINSTTTTPPAQNNKKKSINNYYYKWWIYMHTKYIYEMRHVAYLKNWPSVINALSSSSSQPPEYSKTQDNNDTQNHNNNANLVINEKRESNFIKKKWSELVKKNSLPNNYEQQVEYSIFDKVKIWYSRMKEEGLTSVYNNPYKNLKLNIDNLNIPNYILDNDLYDRQAIMITNLIDNYFEGVLEYSNMVDKHNYTEKYINFDFINGDDNNDDDEDDDDYDNNEDNDDNNNDKNEDDDDKITKNQQNDKNNLQSSYYTI